MKLDKIKFAKVIQFIGRQFDDGELIELDNLIDIDVTPVEVPGMTKGEIQTIRNIIERLKQPRCGAAEGYMEYEEKPSRIYIDTWLIGPLECLLPESRDVDLAERMSRK